MAETTDQAIGQLISEPAARGMTLEELHVERELWDEIWELMDGLSDDDAVAPGYYVEGWSAKDMLGHIGAWLAEAGVCLERIAVGTYRAEEIDIDAMNAEFLATMKDVPLDVVRAQAAAARARMLRSWAALPERTSEADRWVRKAGPEHYLEHLPRLREWVDELTARRAA